MLSSMMRMMSSTQSIHNVSDRSLTLFERSALGLGLSFGLNDDNSIPNFLIAFENFQKFSSIANLDYSCLKGFLLNNIICNNTPSLPQVLKEGLLSLRNDESITVTKADKGNSVVILNSLLYSKGKCPII